jgi:hypothetical protein
MPHLDRLANSMMIWLLSAVAAVGLAFGVGTRMHDPFNQSAFPCMEDEVLMYAPEFGPNKVGCVNIEEIRD